MKNCTIKYSLPGIVLLLLVLIPPTEIWAQCIDTTITVGSDVCEGQNLMIANNSDADEYIWDTCSGELDLVPTADLLVDNREFARSRALRTFVDRGQKYLFSVNNGTKRLTLLTFGDSYFNDPTLFRTIDLRSYSDSPYDLSVIIQNDERYIFVVATNERQILKLSFGNSWFNTPVVSSLSVSFDSNVNGITMELYNNEYYGFVMQDDRVSRLSFGNQVSNNSPVKDEIMVPSGDVLRNLEFVKQCGEWTGIVTSYANGRLIKLSFDSGDPGGSMSTTDLTALGSMNFPAGLSIIQEGDSTYLFIQGAQANLYRAKFDDAVIPSLDVTDLGRIGSFTQSFPIALVKEGPRFVGFTANHNNRQLMSYNFISPCDSDQRLITGESPEMFLTGSGAREISVAMIKGDFTDQKIFKLNVSSDRAPLVGVQIDQACLLDPVSFSYTEDPSGLTINWEFGDGAVASGASVQHVYAAPGEYLVHMEVVSSNGCSNQLDREVLISEDIQSIFSVTNALPCTNQVVSFQNESINVVPGITTYRWYVNNVEVSNEENLSYQFEAAGSYNIRLQATVYGCVAESSQNIAILPGAKAAFTSTNVCNGAETVFENLSEGTIATYAWDFGDGSSANIPNPTHTYPTAGTYEVKLVLTSPNGCVSRQAQETIVHALPEPAFENDLLCAGNQVQFRDMSTVAQANITGWAWDFGAAGVSNQRNPVVTFPAAGTYNIQLQVTSEFGCSESIIRSVVVLPSPVADFTYDPLCPAVPVQFIDQSVPATGTTIVEWAWDLDGGFSGEENPSAVFEPGTYSIGLTVTASNQCIASAQEVIMVGSPLDVQFDINQPCVENISTFIDRTEWSGNTIMSRAWSVDDQPIGIDSIVNYEFANAGDYRISLELTTSDGCSYLVEEMVQILPSRDVTFQFSPRGGSAPLEVQFENTTPEAIATSWFIDNTLVGDESSFSFVFVNEGTFVVRMESTDPSGCIGTATDEIFVGDVRMDLAINAIRTDGQDLVLEVQNRGNIDANEVPLSILAGGEQISFVAATFLPPGQSEVIRIDDANLGSEDICTTIEEIIDGINDVDLSNNGACILAEGGLRISEPYPNPASDRLTVNIASEMGSEVLFLWILTDGKQINVPPVAVFNGFGTYTFDTSAMARGTYYLKVEGEGESEIYRIVLE